MVHTINPSPQEAKEQKQEGLLFEASLVYLMSYRPVRDTLWELISTFP